jgi:hypothetical protein
MQSHLSTLNSAARLMLRRREHVTRHLPYLNWLPIRRRIDFKLGVLAYRLCQCCDRPLPPPPRCLNSSAPLYLSSLLHVYLPRRSVRAGLRPALSISPFRTIAHANRAFSHSCSLVWNSLPPSVTSSPSVPVSRSIC